MVVCGRVVLVDELWLCANCGCGRVVLVGELWSCASCDCGRILIIVAQVGAGPRAAANAEGTCICIFINYFFLLVFYL